VGVVPGLAWTPTGGEILFVEASQMKGKKGLTLTGNLGDVMRESVQAALSYLRAHAEDFGIAPDFFETSDLHIHVPSGAIPKDGPSAGITMATALASLLTGRKPMPKLAMTGEVNLSGDVLPIGGLKEKSLAAHRAGIQTVIIPAENEKDLVDIPKEVRDELEFIAVGDVQSVIDAALAPVKVKSPPRKRKAAPRPRRSTATLRRRRA
jgi:ATP-dependent Lon protease